MELNNGIVPVMPAPFTTDGISIDFESWARVIQYSIDSGASGIAIFGTGTEFYKLSADEKHEMFKIAASICRGRVPLVVTVGSHATELARKEAIKAVAGGADVINIFPPSFVSPTERSLVKHIATIAESVGVPIMIQYAPDLTGTLISCGTFEEISEAAQGKLFVKVEANPTGPAISAIIEATHGRFVIAVGNGGIHMYDALLRGANIIMPGAAMVNHYCDIFNEFASGNWRKAFNLYTQLLPYINTVGQDVEIFVKLEKMVLNRKHIVNNHVCREPNREPDRITVKLLADCIEMCLDEPWDM